ncbi:nicotinamide N-methyltransferase isoform X2 [Manis pentadactyla]|uniref:nicotinamide N-methyltransferase isoform X2 n=1 Tax=Manis pentadactyla TaxID=143292 RepID=UPI00255C6D43|nr:nicotinamide N-methyltransferase isoform X2 [Manis pentadactyla]
MMKVTPWCLRASRGGLWTQERDAMESSFTSKDTYLTHFNPRVYLEKYYSFGSKHTAESEILKNVLKNLFKIFCKDGMKGDLLIDIGSGPTIYQLLSACESFKEIIVSDYSERNLQELEKWLKKEPGAFDWSPVVAYVCELEGNSPGPLSCPGASAPAVRDLTPIWHYFPSPEELLLVFLIMQVCWRQILSSYQTRVKVPEKEEKLRQAVKQVLKCDVTQSRPLGPVPLPLADCVLSTLCLDAACPDLPTYCAALRHLGSLLKPEGFLVVVDALKSSFYMVGEQRFSSLVLGREEIEAAMKEAGYSIEQFEVLPQGYSSAICNNEGLFILVGRKLGGCA